MDSAIDIYNQNGEVITSPFECLQGLYRGPSHLVEGKGAWFGLWKLVFQMDIRQEILFTSRKIVEVFFGFLVPLRYTMIKYQDCIMDI